MKFILFYFFTFSLIFILIYFTYFLYSSSYLNQKTIKGNCWIAKKIGHNYILSVNNHCELVSSIFDLAKCENIKSGEISGLGAINEATLRYFNPDTKKYSDKTFYGQKEIANLIGNISLKDNLPYLHLHITLSDENYNAIAGHLMNAKISGACELFIKTIPSISVKRSFSESIGLNIYNFN